MPKKRYKGTERLELIREGKSAFLQLILPSLSMRPEPDSDWERARHLFIRLTGCQSFNAWLEQNRKKPLKGVLHIDPLEKAFLLKAVIDALRVVGSEPTYRSGLMLILTELKKGGHPLSGNESAAS